MQDYEAVGSYIRSEGFKMKDVGWRMSVGGCRLEDADWRVADKKVARGNNHQLF
jgi:hypothetical protein